MFKKVKIKQLPNMAWGGRVFNQVAPNALPYQTDEEKLSVKKTLQPVAREGANIEAEKGETAFFIDVDGLPAHYKIGGKRHTQGGTPLNVPDDTFIFSDTRAMTIKDKDLLAQFGETKPKTPAEIAGKYDMNKYREVLIDRDTDKLQKETAEKMIQNYTLQLGKLALIQESMKGFPQGIPMISQPYLIVNNIEPTDILPRTGEGSARFSEEMEEQPEASAPNQEMMMPQGKYGINFRMGGSPSHRRIRITGLPSYDKGGPTGTGVRKDLIEFNPRFYEDILSLTQSGVVSGVFPQVNWKKQERERYSTQVMRSQSPNVAGDDDWSRGSFYNDFSQRHQWFLDEYPDFDPHKNADVKIFQKRYCQKMQELGAGSCWFIDKGKSGTGFDGIFGEHTWSAPSLNAVPKRDPEVKVTTEVDDKKQPDIPVYPLQYPSNQGAPFEVFPQDALNLYTGLAQKIPKMDTWYPPAQFEGVQPQLLTPNYHPILSAAKATQDASQAYAPRQKATALSTVIQGKAGEQAAQEFLKVAQTNAGILTDANYKNAMIQNENMKYNGMLEMDDFDARQLYERDRILAQNKKRAGNAQLFNVMLDNAVKAKNMSDMYPQFDIDPSSGGLIRFTQGMPVMPNQAASMSPRVAEYERLRQKYSHEEAIDILGRQTAKAQYNQDPSNYYNPYDYPTGPYTQGT